jgi:nicotinamidase/pyrazinamidase
MPDAVIVVDMQRCFMEEGKTLYCGAQAREIIPRIQKLLERESRRGSQIFFTADAHTENDLEFQMFPRHCVAGTGEAEIIPELQPWVKLDHVIHKRRYSGFFETDLDRRLARLKPPTVKVAGVCTNICVMHSVADLRNRDYHVAVYEDGVASFDPEGHRFALRHMRDVLGAEIRSIAAEVEEPEAETAPVPAGQ